MDTGYTFLDRTAYFTFVRDAAARARSGDRIAIAAMALDIRPDSIQKLLHELAKAAARGAHIRVWIDAMSFMLDEYILPGPLLFGATLSEQSFGPYGARYAALQAIRDAGGDVLITNVPTHPLTMPVAGRSHIKFAVVNDTVCIGGHNLNHPSQMDIMVRWESKQAANYLWNLYDTIRNHNSNVRQALDNKDVTTILNSTTRLLVDAGTPGQSLILNTALDTIDNASQRIIFTCQYFPGGRVAQHLKQAQQRGVDVRIYFSHPRAHKYEASLHYAYNAAQSMLFPRSLFAHRLQKDAPKLHAKLIATESTAIVGSHNFVEQGVKLGTAEIALITYDERFSQAATDAIMQQITDNASG